MKFLFVDIVASMIQHVLFTVTQLKSGFAMGEETHLEGKKII